MVMRGDVAAAGHRRRDQAAAGRAGDLVLRQLLLRGDQLLLHLLRLLQQLRHVGLASGEHATESRPPIRRGRVTLDAMRAAAVLAVLAALLLTLAGCSTPRRRARTAARRPDREPDAGASAASAPAAVRPSASPPARAGPAARSAHRAAGRRPRPGPQRRERGAPGGRERPGARRRRRAPSPATRPARRRTPGIPEHAFTWDVALRMRDRLTAAGVTVVLTRQDDAGVGPCVDVRGQLAGQVGAAAFVGIHGDGAGAGGRGFHVITSSLAPAGPAGRRGQHGTGDRRCGTR